MHGHERDWLIIETQDRTIAMLFCEGRDYGDQAREMLKGRDISPPGAPASRRLRSASCRTRVFANEHAIDQQMTPFRQGNFSESSGGGRMVDGKIILPDSPALLANDSVG